MAQTDILTCFQRNGRTIGNFFQRIVFSNTIGIVGFSRIQLERLVRGVVDGGNRAFNGRCARTADVSHLNSAVIRNGCVSTQYADCALTDVVHDVLSRIKLAAVYCVGAAVADAACGNVGNRTLFACRADAECGLRGVTCKVAEGQIANGSRGRLNGCFSCGIDTQCDGVCMSGIGVFTERNSVACRGFCRIAEGKGVACGGFGVFTEGYGTVLRGLGVVADGDGIFPLCVCFVTQC